MHETLPSVIRGFYRDILLDEYGNHLLDTGWISNRIVDSCFVLISAFMANMAPGQTVSGIDHLAVGQGDPGWDGMTELPKPDASRTDLVTPCYEPLPRTRLGISYINVQENDNALPDTEPCNALIVRAVLEKGYPAVPPGEKFYPLREFGLFGKITWANPPAEKQFMINCVNHRVIEKHASMSLIRTIKLLFVENEK